MPLLGLTQAAQKEAQGLSSTYFRPDDNFRGPNNQNQTESKQQTTIYGKHNKPTNDKTNEQTQPTPKNKKR